MQAMILAAGLGKRLSPLTNTTPKPLLEIAGKSLLDRVLLKLHDAGYRRFIINAFHLADQIVAWSKQLKIDAEIILSVEKELLGTGGGIVHARHYFDNENLLICNSDILFSFDLHTAFQTNALVQLIGVPNPSYKPKGDFSIGTDGIVCINKVNKNTFAGISMVDPAIFKEFSNNAYPYDLWKTIYLPYIMSSQVSAVELQDFWLDVGSAERLQEAKEIIHEYR